MSVTMHTGSRIPPSSDMHVTRLREQRLKHGLSQRELADRSGVSRTSIIKLEGGREAWPQTVRKLATALRVKVADLQ